MKKRFFAGLLACLMVVGLLPLSMLLKPVSAKAAGTHTFEAATLVDIDSNQYTDYGQEIKEVTGFFKFYSCKGSKTASKKWSGEGTLDKKYFSFNGKAEYVKETKKLKGVAEFTVENAATVTIWWYSGGTNRNMAIYSMENENLKEVVASNETRKDFFVTSLIVKTGGTYYLGSKGGNNNIYKIEVVEESASKPVVEPTVKPVEKTSYSVVVNSSNGEKKETVEDGATIDLTTDKTNFLYWINSNGKIVSRKANDTITVYYEDEYTAVYEEDAVVKYMTAYGKVYKSVPASQFKVDEKVAGPVRYGYNFTDWKTSASDIKKAIDNNEKVIIVEPGYESADKSFEVTIDTTALTNGTKENKTSKINEVVKASTDSSEFAYWADDNNNVLSYNATYYFFANRNINVKAVKKTADVSPKGVISLVDKGTNKAGDSVVIFEYTIPSTCTVKFAGVVASPSLDKLTRATAEYVGGDAFSGSTTYRYTITKTKGMDTWYVLPVLEYVDGTQVKSVLWNTPVEF